MSIAKLDLYNPEWLELVFEKRNHAYGAYDLRRHYARNMVKAMAITFFSVAFLYTGYSVLKPRTPAVEPTIIRDFTIKTPPLVKDEHVIPPRPTTARPPSQQATIQYTTMRPTDDREATNPPTLVELDSKPIASATRSGSDEGVNIDIPEQGTGTAVPPNVTEDNTPKDWTSVEVLPTPYGGATAWSKFLQKNIHYPARATEEGKQGKVFLSFIVEKDGTLTNITVERPMGFGLDEEAVRVLKLAPAWKPGIQNGHPVRVKFVIPISFQLADPE